MRRFSLHLLLAAMISASPINAGARCADLALVLAIDSSGSIDADEFRLQVLGYAAAFSDPKVLRALREAGAVDVASVFWATPPDHPSSSPGRGSTGRPTPRGLAVCFCRQGAALSATPTWVMG